MIPGLQRHVFHACMKRHDLVTRKHEQAARTGRIVKVYRFLEGVPHPSKHIKPIRQIAEHSPVRLGKRSDVYNLKKVK